MDRSRMVHSPAGSSDLFMILCFSSLYSGSLWRTDTIVFAKLNKPSLLNKPPPFPLSVFEINKPPGGLIQDFNKQNCLPVNELNINGVTKKDFEQKFLSWKEFQYLLPEAIFHIYVAGNFFISGNFYFCFCFNFTRLHYHTQKQTKKIT